MTSLRSLVIKDGNQQLIRDADNLLVGTGIDASTPGTLSIGTATATGITIGAAAVSTSFPGPVTLQGDVTTVGGTTFTTDATFEGNVTLGNGPSDTVTFATTTTVIGNIAFNGAGYKVTNLLDPTAGSQEAATASWVEAQIAAIPQTPPGAPADSIQFNDGAGGFGGSANLTFDDGASTLAVSGQVQITGTGHAFSVIDPADGEVVYVEPGLYSLNVVVPSAPNTTYTTIQPEQITVYSDSYSVQLSAIPSTEAVLRLQSPAASGISASIIAQDETASLAGLKLRATQIDVDSVKIVNVADGVDPTDAVNKSQLDAAVNVDNTYVAVGNGTGIAGSANLTWNPTDLTMTITGDANPALVVASEIDGAFLQVSPVQRELAIFDPLTPTDSTAITPTDVAVANGAQSGNVSAGSVGVTDNGTTNALSLTIPAGVATIKSVDGTATAQTLLLDASQIDVNSVKIVNVADGVDPNDAVNFSQLSAIVSGVSDVTATAPLLSSGGATPDISIDTAGAANGDVLTFNAGAWAAAAPADVNVGSTFVAVGDGTGIDGSNSLTFAAGELGVSATDPIIAVSRSDVGNAVLTLKPESAEFSVPASVAAFALLKASDAVSPIPLKLDASEFDVNSVKIVNVADGVDANDAVNKSQLDALVVGVSAVSATAPLLSSGGATPDISIDTAGAASGDVLTFNGTAWAAAAPEPGAVFAGALTVYVDPVNGTDAPGGGTLGQPYASINYAYSQVTSLGNPSNTTYNAQVGQFVTEKLVFQLAPGRYVGDVTLGFKRARVQLIGNGVQIVGNVTLAAVRADFPASSMEALKASFPAPWTNAGALTTFEITGAVGGGVEADATSDPLLVTGLSTLLFNEPTFPGSNLGQNWDANYGQFNFYANRANLIGGQVIATAYTIPTTNGLPTCVIENDSCTIGEAASPVRSYLGAVPYAYVTSPSTWNLGTGQATGAQTSTTLQDTTKAWTVNQYAGATVTLTAGTGAGQTATVVSNTATALTISAAWTTTPVANSTVYSLIGTTNKAPSGVITLKTHNSTLGAALGPRLTIGEIDGCRIYDIDRTMLGTVDNGAVTGSTSTSYIGMVVDQFRVYSGTGIPASQYQIGSSSSGARYKMDSTSYTTLAFSRNSSGVLSARTLNLPTSSGTATAGAATTITDTSKAFTTNQWAGGTITLTGGTGSGQTRTVVSNTATAITVTPAWTTNPAAGTTYTVSALVAYDLLDDARSLAYTPTTGANWLDPDPSTVGSALDKVGALGLLAAAPSNGAIPIGNGTNFTPAVLTAGTGISITNGAGSVTITSTGGTVTSVDVSGGSTGLTFSGGPIVGAGTITMAGTLDVDNGGTGATSLTGYVKGNGTSAFTASASVPGADVSGDITGNAANVNGTVAVANGGTGATTLAANAVVLGNGTSAVQTVAPSTSGNVLTSNGTTWQSVAPTDFSTVALNTSTNSVAQGDACYVSAAGTVDEAIADGTLVKTARVAGIASATANRVSVLGIVEDCNFEGSLTLAVGDAVFLSATSAGKLTNVSPSAGPSIIAEIGIITAVNTVGGGAAAADVLWQPKSIIIL